MLRLGLLLSSAGWGISFLFTFTSWEFASEQLFLMGAERIDYQPLLDYWLKMASATFGCLGIASALACAWPERFHGMIQLLGPFHAFLGVILTVSAITNHLNRETHPTFTADITFCFVTSLLISVPIFAGSRRGSGKEN
jgi:predicted anti-sigma-YlaC factor YlaD